MAPGSLPSKRSMSQRRSEELLVCNKVQLGAIDPDQGEMDTIWLGSGDLPLLFDNHIISFYSVSIYHSAVEQKGHQASLQPERLKRCARNQSHFPSDRMSHDVVAQSAGAFCLLRSTRTCQAFSGTSSPGLESVITTHAIHRYYNHSAPSRWYSVQYEPATTMTSRYIMVCM